jgi:hypothetical protein
LGSHQLLLLHQLTFLHFIMFWEKSLKEFAVFPSGQWVPEFSVENCRFIPGEQDQALACHEQCVALSQEMANRVSEAEEYGNF